MPRSKYKASYGDEDMEAALKAVREDGMRNWTAAMRFGVPRSTLLDRLAGRTPDKASMGAPPVLNGKEEAELCRFIGLSAKAGFPLQRRDVVGWVKQILDIDGRDNPFNGNAPGQCQFSWNLILLVHLTFGLIIWTFGMHGYLTVWFGYLVV
jgi:hypothetical protein